MRQRICFAKSLLHEPKLLLLDEPASGLDPAGRLEFRELLKQLHAMGRTIIISSHILTEMTEYCTSIGIMEQGRLLKSGRVGDIVAEMRTGLRLRVEVQGSSERAAAVLTANPSVAGVSTQNGYIACHWHSSRDALPQLHKELVSGGVPVISFSVDDDDLEDVYMRISGHRTS
jgi:ABC-2 type transport system ATP-binding protein